MPGLRGVQGPVEGVEARLRGSGTSLNAYGQLSKKGPLWRFRFPPKEGRTLNRDPS